MISELVLVPPDNNQCWFRRKKYGGRVSGSQRKKKISQGGRKQSLCTKTTLPKPVQRRKRSFCAEQGKIERSWQILCYRFHERRESLPAPAASSSTLSPPSPVAVVEEKKQKRSFIATREILDAAEIVIVGSSSSKEAAAAVVFVFVV